MASATKIEGKWRQYIPPDVDWKDVKKVLKAYGFEQRASSSGHFIFTHPALDSRPDLFSHDPHINFPTVKGRKVKNFYVKNLLMAIDIVEEWKAENKNDLED